MPEVDEIGYTNRYPPVQVSVKWTEDGSEDGSGESNGIKVTGYVTEEQDASFTPAVPNASEVLYQLKDVQITAEEDEGSLICTAKVDSEIFNTDQEGKITFRIPSLTLAGFTQNSIRLNPGQDEYHTTLTVDDLPRPRIPTYLRRWMLPNCNRSFSESVQVDIDYEKAYDCKRDRNWIYAIKVEPSLRVGTNEGVSTARTAQEQDNFRIVQENFTGNNLEFTQDPKNANQFFVRGIPLTEDDETPSAIPRCIIMDKSAVRKFRYVVATDGSTARNIACRILSEPSL